MMGINKIFGENKNSCKHCLSFFPQIYTQINRVSHFVLGSIIKVNRVLLRQFIKENLINLNLSRSVYARCPHINNV